MNHSKWLLIIDKHFLLIHRFNTFWCYQVLSRARFVPWKPCIQRVNTLSTLDPPEKPGSQIRAVFWDINDGPGIRTEDLNWRGRSGSNRILALKGCSTFSRLVSATPFGALPKRNPAWVSTTRRRCVFWPSPNVPIRGSASGSPRRNARSQPPI